MVGIPPVGMAAGETDGPDGYSYGAVLVRGDDGLRPDVEEVLRGLRFSGWIAPSDRGWIVLLGDHGAGVVAKDRRGAIDVGADLARRLPGAVVAVQVRRDRQLAIVAWRGGDEAGRYCSDPSLEPGADADVAAEPVGSDSASAFAELAQRPDAAEALAELLEDELDPDSVFESERLRGALRLLGMPDWIVAANALPHDIPTGPRARDLMRVRVGATGAAGVLRDVFVRRLRRRRIPPAVIADPPRQGGMSGLEPWMF
ncbi:hypothetical protein ACH3VR_02415 [Microbacterium sp. B2969]|uniref:Uncharacterized protein n=1 Tax=Microbacterium alkaliflavum TaxID=3248839 RepID=A0ABW7Q4U2_9MICO